MSLLPLELLLIVTFLFGLIIGSFLNVVIYRLHTGHSLNNRSHCLSCGTMLQWYELFPLFSYLALGGRCRTCGALIPPRYFFVELLTGIAFLGAAWYAFDLLTFLKSSILLALLIVIVVYDLRHFIIPDELVVVLTVLAGVVVVGESFWQADGMGIVQALLAGGLASGSYGSLWLLSSGRWIGLGDVKLAFPLGVLVGVPFVFSLVVWSFWIGAAVSVALLGAQALLTRGKKHLHIGARPLTIKSEVPFAPFLVAAFILTYFGAVNVLDMTRYFSSLTLHLF